MKIGSNIIIVIYLLLNTHCFSQTLGDKLITEDRWAYYATTETGNEWYYDRESIVYPKAILPDWHTYAEIWVKIINADKQVSMGLFQFDCDNRKVTIKWEDGYTQFMEPIKPESVTESLFNTLCK